MPDLDQFHQQVKQGQLAEVRASLAEHPALLNSTNASGQSAFLLAKYYHRDDVADYLLTLNPKLDLFNACVAGLEPAVLAELDRNPSLLTTYSGDGWTPLHLAAFFGHIALTDALLKRNADVNARSTNGLNNAPLHAAAAGGHTEVVALLLKHNANPNARQEGGWTALHAAAQAGNRPMVEALLSSGADPTIRAANNQLPLDLALSKGHGEVAALLEHLTSGPAVQ